MFVYVELYLNISWKLHWLVSSGIKYVCVNDILNECSSSQVCCFVLMFLFCFICWFSLELIRCCVCGWLQPLAPICELCSTQKPKEVADKYKVWGCKFCTLENSMKLDKCKACGQWRYSHGPPVAAPPPNLGTWGKFEYLVKGLQNLFEFQSNFLFMMKYFDGVLLWVFHVSRNWS